MSKKFAHAFLLCFILICVLTIGVVTANNQSMNGGFWSQPVEAAQIRFTDLERGNDDIIHLLGFDSCCPIEMLYTQRDLGGSWSSTETVDNNMDSSRPWEGDLAVGSDGTAHAIWTDQEGGSNHKVKYAQRPAGGNWTAPMTLSNPDHDANDLALIINNNNQLYASWSAYGTPGLYTRYQVGGNWGAIQRVDMNQPPLDPIMLMDSQQNVHYFWFYGSFPAVFNVYYRKLSADNNWGSVTPISDPHSDNTDIPPSLRAVVEGSNIHVTWSVEKNSQHDMYYTEYVSGSWSSPIQLNSGSDSQYPQFLGASGGNIYIVSYNNDDEAHSYRFRPSGGSWTAESMGFLGTLPKILGLVTTDNTFHLVWDNFNDPLQYRSRQNLGSWTEIETVGSGFGLGGYNTIKQKGIHIDMGWENNGNDSSYAHALIQFTNLPPQSYIPTVLK